MTLPFFTGYSMNQHGLELLQGLLGMLRALKWFYWNSHWMAKGQPYYGDHLLFERMYEGKIDEQIDTLAEKITAYEGNILSTPMMRDAFNSFLDGIPKAPDLRGDASQTAQTALAMERHFQGSIKKVYDFLKQQNELSLGMDDFLMAMANQRETVIYLLQQRIR